MLPTNVSFEQRRRLFNEAAELYDEVRPGYPESLYATLAALVPSPARVLEIGTGTGQLTRGLMSGGYAVTAAEPGANLAAVLRQRLPHVQASAFDLIVAATSWHWLDGPAATDKASAALRPGGLLAVIWNKHVRGATDEFWSRDHVEGIYARLAPELLSSETLQAKGELPQSLPEIVASPFFESLPPSSHPHSVSYDADGYIDLTRTFSDHLALPDATRLAIEAETRVLIDERFGGHVIKQYDAVVYPARRNSRPWST